MGIVWVQPPGCYHPAEAAFVGTGVCRCMGTQQHPEQLANHSLLPQGSSCAVAEVLCCQSTDVVRGIVRIVVQNTRGSF